MGHNNWKAKMSRSGRGENKVTADIIFLKENLQI